MSALIARDLERSFGDRHVLRGADLEVRRGERVGLVGPNGCGKSTLLAVLAGRLKPDIGVVTVDGRLGVLEQEPVLPGHTVGEALDEAMSWHTELVASYQRALAAGDLEATAAAQDRLDTEGWDITHRIEGIANRVGAPPRGALLEHLSGGERRRVALARSLISSPDVLLLDEPTNHLDGDAIEWLEAWLIGFSGALLLVTHDRYLLEAVSTRIVEVEDGHCVSYDDCSYTDYLVARAGRRAVAERTEARRLSMIEHEAAWAARSPSARSTKQKARLQRLDELREARPLPKEASFTLDLRTGLKLGSTIFEMHGVNKRFGDLVIARDLEVSIAPGERWGFVGPNGVGKTTLLRIIQGIESADSGQIVRGRRIQFGLIDQKRSGLNDDDTLFDAVAGGHDQVTVRDQPVFVASFLDRFQFPRASFDQKVGALSGGERARLLLAKLLLAGANVLLLDEPTNDLDLLTLRVLEEALLGFDGVVLVVTHDRAFLDRVCTDVLGFHGNGRIVRYADRLQFARAVREEQQPLVKAKSAPPPRPKAASGRISYKEQQELAGLPAVIERLEAQQAALESTLADPATYAERGSEVAGLTAQLEALAAEIETAYSRWTELEERA